MIFSDYERTDSSPKKNRESDFFFLDRSARPEIAVVRGFVEQLLIGYPSDEVAEIISRIRSGNDVHFRSAGFELLLFDFLNRLGYKLHPHPELKNKSTKQPDFHVVAPDGSEFYLEAVLSTEEKDRNWSANAMINTTLDILNSKPHPNFYVGIASDGEPKTQPSGRKLQSHVLAWLNKIDPDSLDTAPTLEWKHEDWNVSIQAIPVKAEFRGKTTILIGMESVYAGIIDSWTPIRDSLRGKGQRYGELELPLLVALNFSAFNLSPDDEMQALYGEEQFQFSVQDPGAKPKFSRVLNGLWQGPSGHRAKRVSGAWLFNDLTFYTAACRKQTVYFNPWANHQLPEVLKQLPNATVGEDSVIQRSEGVSLREVFKLPENWPE